MAEFALILLFAPLGLEKAVDDGLKVPPPPPLLLLLFPNDGLVVPNGAKTGDLFMRGDPAVENDIPGDAEKVEKSEITLREEPLPGNVEFEFSWGEVCDEGGEEGEAA